MTASLNSENTAISRTKMSAPMRELLEKYGKNIVKNKSILDYGCGKSKDVCEALKLGYNIKGYDPYWCKEVPAGKFSIIYCG